MSEPSIKRKPDVGSESAGERKPVGRSEPKRMRNRAVLSVLHTRRKL